MAVVAVFMLVLARPSVEAWWQGLCLAILGELWRLYALGYTGEPTRSSELTAPKLVTSGPYAFCRNPLYWGNCLNGMGVAWAASGGWPIGQRCLILLGCAMALALVYYACIKAEERFLAEKFGEEYRDYCRRTPCFVPHWRMGAHEGASFHWHNLSFEKMSLLWWLLTWGYLALRLYF